MLFALLLMLCGALISGMKWMGLGPFKETKKVEKKVRVEKKDPTRFVDMDPMAIPIFQGNRVAATVQIQVKLETLGDKNATQIRRMMPVITDAFVRDLHGFLPRLLKAEERIDVLIIKQRLQMISDKVAGTDLIRNVLVQSVIDQPR